MGNTKLSFFIIYQNLVPSGKGLVLYRRAIRSRSSCDTMKFFYTKKERVRLSPNVDFYCSVATALSTAVRSIGVSGMNL